MIRSFYHHGAEVPATDLSPEQMQAALADAGGVLWVDMLGAPPEAAEEILRHVFGFHPLTIDDCLEGGRRPKLDDYGDYIFFVIQANDRSVPLEDINTVELGVYLGPNFVVTYHPLPLPAINRVAERAMQDECVMNLGADNLVYQILRAIESDYKPAVDSLSAAVAGIEVEVLAAPTRDTLHRMYELRHDVLRARRALAPQQDVISRLAAYELQPIKASNRLYFRELADRFAQMAETVNTQCEYLGGAMQTHLSVIANQTHNLLRRVAVTVAIVLPLTWLGVLCDSSLKATPVLGTSYVGMMTVGIILIVAAMLALYFYRA